MGKNEVKVKLEVFDRYPNYSVVDEGDIEDDKFTFHIDENLLEEYKEVVEKYNEIQSKFDELWRERLKELRGE